MDQIFNNRELASSIWLLLFAIWVITKRDVRKTFRPLITVFLNWRILVPLMAMIAYVVLIVIGLNAIGFWDVSAMKDTVFWMLGFASITLFHANKIDDVEDFFKDAVLNNLKLIAVLEFVSNAYTFSILIELLLVPLLTFITLLKTVAGFKTKMETSYRLIDNLLGYALAFTGIVLIGIAIYNAIIDFRGFMTIHTLKDFLLLPVLSCLYLPFIYSWALLLAYEHLFVRIDIQNTNRELARYLKKCVLRNYHFKLVPLLHWARRPSSLHINNREEALTLVKPRGNG